jgi:prepilin-type N-terminal cleavage/methylation domain-containing protein
MKRRNAGFTLIEMLIVIAIFGFVLAGTSQMFVSTLTTHRQQSRIAETNIEGIIGLELLRQDLGKAGYGLPWNGLAAYDEADGDPYTLNDEATALPPRGIVSANNVAGGSALPGTDYLAIKATNVATNAACSKWTFLSSGVTATTTGWTPASEDLSINDWAIVLSPGTLTSSAARDLVTLGTQFGTQRGAVADFADTGPDNETRIVYGIHSNTPALASLRMPFNRADYYVKIPASEMPGRCAGGTGNLYKAVVRQSDGRMTDMPLLDCVADMQVIYRQDLDGDGFPDVRIQDISALNAQEIREQIKEVRVFVLAQEGQRDRNYVHPLNSMYVGDLGFGRDFNFDTNSIENWQNYRWKIYTLVVKLDNLL